MSQKKVGFSNTSNIQGDKLIINNGLTSSVNFRFSGGSTLTFSLPTNLGSAGLALITDGLGNLSFGTVSSQGNVQVQTGSASVPKHAYWTGSQSLSSSLLEEGNGQLLFPSGTLAAPGISFLLDENTGFRRSGNDQVSVVLGGADSTTFLSSGIRVQNLTYTGTLGTSGHVLATDGSGNTYWTDNMGDIGPTGPQGPIGPTGAAGTSGTSGQDGSIGPSGTSGTSGQNGTSGTSGVNGTSGTTGTSGTSGINGTSGTSGQNGTSGTSGVNGATGPTGNVDALYIDGWLNTASYSTQILALTNSSNWTLGSTFSGSISSTFQGQRYYSDPYIYDAINDNAWVRTRVGEGVVGATGVAGTSGTSGTSGSAGTSGTSGTRGTSGTSGQNGTSGTSGQNGTSGTSGQNGTSGTSGQNGTSGTSGQSGTSGTSGINGTSGTSATSGTSGVNGLGNATATGTTNTIAKFTGATALGNSTIIDNGSQAQFVDGSVATPSISFINDTDTGMYRPAANQLGFSINSAIAGRFGTNSGVSSFMGEDGTVARPGIGFFGDLDTGVYRPTTNQVGIAAGGATSAIFDSVGIEVPDGSATTPSFTFINDPDTGIYRPSANQVGIGAGNGLRVLIGVSQTQFSNNITIQDGLVGTPSLTFFNDTDTGFYRNGTNDLAITAGGTLNTRFAGVAVIHSVPLRISNGTASSPGIVFSNDLDTGIFTPVSGGNQIGIAAGGNPAAIFGATNSMSVRTYFERAVNHQPVVNSSVSGLYTIDMSASNVFNLTLTGNTTLDYSNSYEGSYVLLITQDGTGGRTLGLTGGGKFIGATAMSIATASNSKSLVQLIHIGTQSIVSSTRNLTVL